MPTLKQQSSDYRQIEKAIYFIRNHAGRLPEPSEIAAGINLSEYHLLKRFRRWAGVSPERFMRYLTKEYTGKRLDESKTVLDTAGDTALPGRGRLGDLWVVCETLTREDDRKKGEEFEIAYGVHPSPFGDCFIGASPVGICALSFLQGENMQPLLEALKRQWPHSKLTHSKRHTGDWADKTFDSLSSNTRTPIHLLVNGTRFQIKVWQALLKIPFAKLVAYEDIAKHIRMPLAARAVGNAVGQNPVSFLIPCHRVIRKTGDFGNYGGGRERKIAMLGWEAAHAES